MLRAKAGEIDNNTICVWNVVFAAMETIDMQELEQELQKTRRMFDQWADVATQAATDTKAAHISRLQAAKGSQTHPRSSSPLRTPIEEQERLIQKLSSMQQQLEQQLQQQQQDQTDVAKQLADQDHDLSSLRKLTSAYERCLGLRLEAGDDHLKMVFTQISEAAPEEAYTFSVKVQGDNSYAVLECVPEVPGWQELEQQMLKQQPQNFAGFVAAMRRKFKELAAATDGVAAMSLQQRQQRRRS